MKQSIKVSISTISFNIDDDAYDILNDYLGSLKQHFTHTVDSNEIISDIEMRIAELLQIRLSSPESVVSLEDATAIINIMGNPIDFAEVEQNEPKESTASSVKETISAKPEKKLYRDMDDKTIAGVCGGLSHYFKIDVVVFRILFVFLFAIGIIFASKFAFGATVAYIILWLSMPKATTFEQKVRMTGTATTITHISDRSGNQNKEYKGSSIRELLKFTFRTILIIIGIIFTLLIGCIIASFVWVSYDTNILHAQNYFDFVGVDSFSFKLALALLIALPILGLINLIVKLFNFSSFKTQNFILLVVGFGIWIAAGAYIGSKTTPFIYKLQKKEKVNEVATVESSSDILYIQLDKLHTEAIEQPNNRYLLYRDDETIRNFSLLPSLIQLEYITDSISLDKDFKVKYTTTIRAENNNKLVHEAKNTKMEYSITDSLLTLSPKWYNKNKPWDLKETRIYVTIPYGKQVKLLGQLEGLNHFWIKKIDAQFD